MADYGEMFTNAFSTAFNAKRDAANREKMLRLQSELQNQELTPELKAFLIYQQNPSLWSEYKRDEHPFEGMRLGLAATQNAGELDLAKQKFDLDKAYKTWMMSPRAELGEPTNRRKDYEWLTGNLKMPHQQAIDLLFKSTFPNIFGPQPINPQLPQNNKKTFDFE